MNELVNTDQIKTFIDNITWQTALLYKGNIDGEKLAEFRKHLEERVLINIIEYNKDYIKIEKNGYEGIKIALIASGISKDGKIPRGEEYKEIALPINKETYEMAKTRTKEISNEKLQVLLFDRIISMRKSPNKLGISGKTIQVPELISLQFELENRIIGYIDEEQRLIDYSTGALFVNWETEKETLEESDLKDTITYDICSYFSNNELPKKHYSLAVENALIGITSIDLFVSMFGINSFEDDELLNSTLDNINAALLTDRELIEPYARRFKKEIACKIKKGNKEKEYGKIIKFPGY